MIGLQTLEQLAAARLTKSVHFHFIRFCERRPLPQEYIKLDAVTGFTFLCVTRDDGGAFWIRSIRDSSQRDTRLALWNKHEHHTVENGVH